MEYGWLKVNGYSYVGRLSDIDMEKKTCTVSFSNATFTEVPFSELQPIYDQKLPWE